MKLYYYATADINRSKSVPKLLKNINSSKQNGFTLIELMIVITIIGIMAVMIVPKLFGNISTAQRTKAQSDLASIGVALDLYKLANFDYPTTNQGLQALISKPSNGPEPQNWTQYLNKIPKDPWMREYRYLSPGENGEYDLYSFGRDGRLGGEDENIDITSWE